MKKDNKKSDFLFEGLEPPAPPSELREKILRRSMEVLDLEERSDVWSLIWASPVARAAWVACFSFLVVGHALLSLRPPAPDRIVKEGSRPGPDKTDWEISQIASLPRIRTDLLPQGLFGENSPVKRKESKI